MKPTPTKHRAHPQGGTVLANMLFAIVGVIVGAVATLVGVGLCAAVALPALSTAHGKSRAPIARATARVTTDTNAGTAREQPVDDSPTRSAESLATTLRSVRDCTAKRNAQTLASVFAAGEAAGVEWSASDVDSAVSQLVAGAAPKSGPFAGRTFQVPNRAIDDLQLAKDYLQWDGAFGTLRYTSTDADPTN